MSECIKTEGIKNLKVYLDSLDSISDIENVIIVPHKNVDFDAIASAVGFSLLATKMKKNSYIVVDDSPCSIDHGVQIIINEAKKTYPIINRDKYLQIRKDSDLIVLVDVNKKYLISLKDDIDEAKRVIIIDHHDSDESTVHSDCEYIDTSMSSASEIVMKLLSMYRIKPNACVANYLLAGIYLDTNKFTKNVTPDTMSIVTKLLECGASMNRVTDLFTEDFNSDRKVQELVSKAKITNYSVATIVANQDDEYTREELAKAADYLLKFGVDAAFAVGKIGDNTVSISARSKERVNVGEIMHELDGGGNPFSAATKLTETTTEEAGKRLLKTITPPFYTVK